MLSLVVYEYNFRPRFVLRKALLYVEGLYKPYKA